MSQMTTGLSDGEKGHGRFGRLLSPRQTCERLGISTPTLYLLINSGELESLKLGTARRITERSVDRLIERKLAEQAA